MERARDRYSFREYYDQMLEQFHCSSDTASLPQHFRVVPRPSCHVVRFLLAPRHLSSPAEADERRERLAELPFRRLLEYSAPQRLLSVRCPA